MNEQEVNYMSSLFLGASTLEKRDLINLMPNKIVRKYYIRHDIPKRTGGIRVIYEPCQTLKTVQRRINRWFLKDAPVSDFAFAYVKGRCILDNAKPHVSKPILLKLDIHHFFDNIHFESVFDIFKSLGFSENFARLVAGLTTVDDYLPQGAPTSPALSNLFLKEFDEEIGEYCSKNDIVYTRYSDDLTFSMYRFNPDLVKFVREKLGAFGLELNRKKSKIICGPLQKRVTGVVVNNKPQVPRSYRHKIRQEMYYISKYGLDASLNTRNITDKEKHVSCLLGQINFVLQINKNDDEFKKYREILMTPSLDNLRSQLTNLLN